MAEEAKDAAAGQTAGDAPDPNKKRKRQIIHVECITPKGTKLSRVLGSVRKENPMDPQRKDFINACLTKYAEFKEKGEENTPDALVELCKALLVLDGQGFGTKKDGNVYKYSRYLKHVAETAGFQGPEDIKRFADKSNEGQSKPAFDNAVLMHYPNDKKAKPGKLAKNHMVGVMAIARGLEDHAEWVQSVRGGDMISANRIVDSMMPPEAGAPGSSSENGASASAFQVEEVD